MPRALLTLIVAIVAATGYFFSKTWLPALASSSGEAIDQQLTLNFILLGVVFCATQLALGLFVWKYRERPDSSHVSGEQPSAHAELTWLALAAVLFLGLNIASAILSLTKYPVERLTVVEITGAQFRWYFRYAGPNERFGRIKPGLIDAAEGNPLGIDRSDPDSADDIVTTTLVVPEGQAVRVTLRSQDVIHSFFVPSLRFKQDAVPGQEIVFRLPPVKVGVYDIACAQLCGMGHYQMNAKLKVVPEAEYETWLSRIPPYRQGQVIRAGHNSLAGR